MHAGLRLILFANLFAGLGPMAPAQGAPAVPSAEDFAAPPRIADVVVSPSGQRMALLVAAVNGRVRLGVMDLEPFGEPRIVAAFDDANVTRVRWINDNRSVLEAFRDGTVIEDRGAGTFAVNHDGSGWRQLIAWAHHTKGSFLSQTASRVLPCGWFLYSTVDDGSDDVFACRQVRDAHGDEREIELARLNTKSGVSTSLARDMPDGTQAGLLDAAKEPRVLTAWHDGKEFVYWRDPKGDGGWAEIARFETRSRSADSGPWRSKRTVPCWSPRASKATFRPRTGSTRGPSASIPSPWCKWPGSGSTAGWIGTPGPAASWGNT